MNSLTRWGGCTAVLLLSGTTYGAIHKDSALFTLQQAAEGKALFSAKCTSCHGDALQGGSGPALAGVDFAWAWAADDLAADWATRDGQSMTSILSFGRRCLKAARERSGPRNIRRSSRISCSKTAMRRERRHYALGRRG